jgi:hypothetical protein
MSALPPKADIGRTSRDVRFVPTGDIVTIGNDQFLLLMERGVSAEMTPRVVGCITRKPSLTAIANKPSVQLFLSSSGQKLVAVSSCK